VKCPHCASTSVTRTGRHRRVYQRYRCKACKRIFNDRTGTIFQDSRLPLKLWFLLALLQRGRSILEVSNSVGMNYDTAHRVVVKLRQSGYPDLIASSLSRANSTSETWFADPAEAGLLVRRLSKKKAA